MRSSLLREEDLLHHILGAGWVLRWLIKPIFALKLLGQWGQASAVGSRVPWTLPVLDFLVAGFLFAVSWRRDSYAAAPLLMAPRQAARFWAVVSHELWSVPKSFTEAFRVSLNLHGSVLQSKVLNIGCVLADARLAFWLHGQPSRVVSFGALRRCSTYLSARGFQCLGLCPATLLWAVCGGSWGEIGWVSWRASGILSRSRLHIVVWWGQWLCRHWALSISSLLCVPTPTKVDVQTQNSLLRF